MRKQKFLHFLRVLGVPRFAKIKLFDFHKKLIMERRHLNDDLWGRTESTADIDAAIALVRDRRYERCLDVGTGLGYYAERAALFCDDVVGMDISARAVAQARKKLAYLHNVSFRTGNLRTTLPQDSYDLIMLGDVLYYLGDVRFPEEFKGVIKNIRTALRRGGRILMTNHVSQGRTTQQVQKYSDLFKAEGLKVEKEMVFVEGKRSWIFTVLCSWLVLGVIPL